MPSRSPTPRGDPRSRSPDSRASRSLSRSPRRSISPRPSPSPTRRSRTRTRSPAHSRSRSRSYRARSTSRGRDRSPTPPMPRSSKVCLPLQCPHTQALLLTNSSLTLDRNRKTDKKRHSRAPERNLQHLRRNRRPRHAAEQILQHKPRDGVYTIRDPGSRRESYSTHARRPIGWSQNWRVDCVAASQVQ